MEILVKFWVGYVRTFFTGGRGNWYRSGSTSVSWLTSISLRWRRMWLGILEFKIRNDFLRFFLKDDIRGSWSLFSWNVRKGQSFFFLLRASPSLSLLELISDSIFSVLLNSADNVFFLSFLDLSWHSCREPYFLSTHIP